MGITPKFPEEDGTKAEKRANGKVDATSEYDGRHHQGEKADFDGVTENIASVIVGSETATDGVEVEPLEDEDEE